MIPKPWEFGYAPVVPAAGPPEDAFEVVVATSEAVSPERVAGALETGARVETLLARPPLFWTRARLARGMPVAAVASRLRGAGLALRYVASAERPSLSLGPPLDCRGAPPARPAAWRARDQEEHGGSFERDGEWFLRDGEGGVGVDRRLGCGAGTRLAVIDDDALEADALTLDAEVLVELVEAPRHSVHGPLMVAWATRARGFEGVAPDASARLYLIPKPGRGVLGFPLALARAALDGADVIVCATYVEGSTSPMLDDALELAVRLGRRGRGAAVVLPTGREAGTPSGSIHASLSLGLGEPAADPRVFCVAPGARGDGWFLFRDRRGKHRPFANRGPGVRWLAPGDDIAYPFSAPDAPARLFHAESSGASAIAAGVLVLVLAANRGLRLSELEAVVSSTLVAVSPDPAPAALADPADLLPRACDRDAHNAKHGYGRLHAGRACLAAGDPICAALLAMGEGSAARAFAELTVNGYPRRLGRWAVRAMLADRVASHALRAVVRHLRLVAFCEARTRAHGHGAVVRQLQVVVRRLLSACRSPAGAEELQALERRLAKTADDAARVERFEQALAELARKVFAPSGPTADIAAVPDPPCALRGR